MGPGPSIHLSTVPVQRIFCHSEAFSSGRSPFFLCFHLILPLKDGQQTKMDDLLKRIVEVEGARGWDYRKEVNGRNWHSCFRLRND